MKKQKVAFLQEPEVVEVAPIHAQQVPTIQDIVCSSELSDQLLMERFRFRQLRQGVRGDPEPPTLVAKVCSDEGRGEMWLSGLPTANALPEFQRRGVNIQVVCFSACPEHVQLFPEDMGTQGRMVPGARYLRLEMSNPGGRVKDLRRIANFVVQSL